MTKIESPFSSISPFGPITDLFITVIVTILLSALIAVIIL